VSDRHSLGPGRAAHTAIPSRHRPISRLGDLGAVKLESGAAYIYRENSQRFVPLKFSVRERDLGSTIAEAQERIRPQGEDAARLSDRLGW